ncbi:beta strand repeat-containing protein [Fimbriiglobus ruber]|uniref:Putative autotransporter protein n=1 Tax=Fimbriiglobus ruber TaxID=1908690 RepID=A0A225E310_9BACT|nr:autotransporter-associated beta strand repeat-containing protein [Fimbriiglobus ruber]OWK43065.1 putative autotransporter protein [Fimbriiglobus ruber]
MTPATLHWLGSAGANGNLWSVGANWLENRAPLSGDHLVFDTTTPGFSATANGFAPSDDISGLTNLSIAINDNSAAGDFAITGNAFGLVAAAGVGVTSTLSVGTAASINNNIGLGADTTVDVGLGSLTLGGVVSGSGDALTVAGSPSGTLTLGAANTYSGGTVLTSGTVSVNTNTSLGTGVLTFDGGTLANAANFLKLPNSFVAIAPSTIGGGGFFELDGNGTLDAKVLLANSGFLTLNGALSGPNGLSSLTGSTTLGGTQPNTFAGGLTTIAGKITLQKTAGVNAVESPVTVDSTGALALGANNQLNGASVAELGQGSEFYTNGYSDSVASLTGPGTLNTATTAAAGLTVTGAGSPVFTGPVFGSGFVTYNGSGSFTLAGTSSSYTGTLTAAGGSLLVSANFSGATADVTGGTLGGTGIVKSIAATGGSVDPAASASDGTLNTAAGSFVSSLNGAAFRADLGSSDSGDHLFLGSSATLNLTGATLTVDSVGGTFADTYPIITSPTGGLSGTFNSLPDSSTVSVGGQMFQINYTPTAVTLTNLGSGAPTLHWIGATNSNWSVASNWAEGTTPVSGDTLVFDTSTPGFAGTVAAFAPTNDVGELTDIAIVINDSSTAGDFTIGGDPLGLVTTAGVGISGTIDAGTAATINNALTLAADTTIDAGLGTLTLGGAISGGFSLTAAGSPAGTVTLNVANAYTGGTVLDAGTVAVNNAGALGTGTLTFNGGTLANVGAFFHVPNAFVVSAPSTIGGGSFFELDGNGLLNANLRLTNSGSLTLAGAISGTGGLIEDGGSTTLAGTTANTYTGPTVIRGGGLKLDKTPGVNAVASPISVAGGSGFPTLVWGASDQLNGGAPVEVGIDGVLSMNGFSDAIASLSGIGQINTGSTSTTGLTVSGSGAQLFAGKVVGSGLLTYSGTGSLTLGGPSSTYTGQLAADGGALLVSADFSGATALSQGSGTLGGTGVVKTLLPTSTGTLNPGGSGVGGILMTTAGVTPASVLSGETFQVDLTDTGLSDQLVIGDNSTIDLSNATLSVNVLHSSPGSIYTIVSSTTGGIGGTFTGLPDGTTFAAGGRQFKIHYTASAVTLTDSPTIALSPTSLPAGEIGLAYSETINPSGGAGAITLAVSGVTNATGLTIAGDGTGTITVTGTPTTAGTVTFTVTPSDVTGARPGVVYSFAVSPAVTVGPATLPSGEAGLAYTQSITGTGGSGAITLAVSGVTNPTGLTIAGSGTGTISLTGTPTGSGTVTFTVTPTDAIGTGAGTTYSFVVSPAATVNPATLPAGEVGLAYTQSITGGGGSGAVTLAVSGVTNPTGLTIAGNETGTISVTGTPTTAGTVTFTVTPTDAIGTGVGTTYSFAVNPGVALSASTLPAGEVGLAYTQSITGTGGAGFVTLAVSG